MSHIDNSKTKNNSDSKASPEQMGMDRKIETHGINKRSKTIAFVLTTGLLGFFVINAQFSGRSIEIQGQSINTAKVSSGFFEDYIPLRTRVVPIKTVYLDAVQGGRVEEILVEDGAMVSAGQTLLRLSNSDLQLSVMSTESRVMEQLSAMRDQQLRLEQNRLAHKRNLVEVNYKIRRLERDLPRQKVLFEKGHISDAQFEGTSDQLHYLRQKRALILESQESDEKMMSEQLSFFQSKTRSMEDNLAFARKSLDELNVRAPLTGKLSGFDMEMGQSIARGVRIGQVDNPDTFKLIANIDEFYLNRVGLDQDVALSHQGKEFSLAISKIYPNVKNGQFQVDLRFLGDITEGIRRGQTLQAKLTLGAASQARLIPNASFVQNTGGQWVFVVTPDGREAKRRPVRLGRRNKLLIEVLEGLEHDEIVITSSYDGFEDMDKISIN